MKTKTGFSHPKCYAGLTNDCSKKLSGEHYFSKGILEFFKHDNKVTVGGLKWQKANTLGRYGLGALTANILCTKHNIELSKFDATALSLFRTIKSFDADFNTETPKKEKVIVNGKYLEKWMLKTAVGLIVSESTSTNGIPDSLMMKEVYIDLLFNDDKWPESWGLYLQVNLGDTIHKYDALEVQFMTANNELKAARFYIENFQFVLLLGNPDQPELWGFNRLNKIYFRNKNTTKELEIDWEDARYDKWIELVRGSTREDAPDHWEEWMKK